MTFDQSIPESGYRRSEFGGGFALGRAAGRSSLVAEPLAKNSGQQRVNATAYGFLSGKTGTTPLALAATPPGIDSRFAREITAVGLQLLRGGSIGSASCGWLLLVVASRLGETLGIFAGGLLGATWMSTKIIDIIK